MLEMMTASGCVCVWVVCHVSPPNASHGCQQAVIPHHRDKPLYNTVENVIRCCQINFPTFQRQTIKWQVVSPDIHTRRSAHSSSYTHKGERTWHLCGCNINTKIAGYVIHTENNQHMTSHLSWHIFPHTAALCIHINAD